MPPAAQATIERLKAALREHPYRSPELLDAVEAAEDGGVPLHEIEEVLDAVERKALAAEAERETC